VKVLAFVISNRRIGGTCQAVSPLPTLSYQPNIILLFVCCSLLVRIVSLSVFRYDAFLLIGFTLNVSVKDRFDHLSVLLEQLENL
jgi:hypothetical protein